MVSKAFASIERFFKENFPDVKVLLNWPDPNQKIVYPYISIINVNQDLMSYPEKVLETFREDDVQKSVFSLGEWRCRVDVNYFAQNSKDLADFTDKVFSLFRNNPVDDLSNRDVVIPFNTENNKYYEVLSLRFIKYTLDQESYGLHRGKTRRTIFEFGCNFPDLVTHEIPNMTDIRLENPEVSESVRVP